jgi:hypothetical protein
MWNTRADMLFEARIVLFESRGLRYSKIILMLSSSAPLLYPWLTMSRRPCFASVPGSLSGSTDCIVLGSLTYTRGGESSVWVSRSSTHPSLVLFTSVRTRWFRRDAVDDDMACYSLCCSTFRSRFRLQLCRYTTRCSYFY